MFARGELHGKGERRSAVGARWAGVFFDGKLRGEGRTARRRAPSTLQPAGLQHGHGRCVYADGAVYEAGRRGCVGARHPHAARRRRCEGEFSRASATAAACSPRSRRGALRAARVVALGRRRVGARQDGGRGAPRAAVGRDPRRRVPRRPDKGAASTAAPPVASGRVRCRREGARQRRRHPRRWWAVRGRDGGAGREGRASGRRPKATSMRRVRQTRATARAPSARAALPKARGRAASSMARLSSRSPTA